MTPPPQPPQGWPHYLYGALAYMRQHHLTLVPLGGLPT
jgi:hypothetical protein